MLIHGFATQRADPYLSLLPRKLGSPPAVVRAFIEDMHAFFEEKQPIKRDEIAARQFMRYGAPWTRKLRITDARDFSGNEGLRMTGICVDNQLPHGGNLASDLRRRLPALRVNLIFDVGANIGQSIREFVLDYADARILSFEPDPNTFATLKSNYGNHQQVSLRNMALGDRPGRLYFDNTSPVSEIHAISKDQNNTALPLVDVTTIDQVCSDCNIDRLSLLKIDTEGNDLNVIRGASRMLLGGLIDVIVAECSLAQTSMRLVSFSALQSAMREYNYVCFGIYDQSFGARPGDLEINWGNCAFVKGIE